MVRFQQGDVVKVSFDPTKGHEQRGYRPAVVVSNRIMHDRMSFIYMCPITHTDRNNAFHYMLEGYDFVDGFVMCDQLKSMDTSARNISKIGSLIGHDLDEILDRIGMLLENEW